MKVLKTYNLTKIFKGKTAVDSINLSVERGLIFGFLGENGAGKSTFINIITGLVNPTSGSFEILGHEGEEIEEIRNKIGVLPDYSIFYEDLSALEHLIYFSKILKLNLYKSELVSLLEKVGLEDAIHLKTKNYSFGMKKKLGIAQALVNKPDILFLDEPTSGVDANSILNIHSLIKEVAAKGTTVFLTSHNLDEVEKICDEIAIMNQGKIQKEGNMEKLRFEYKNSITVYLKHNNLDQQKEVLSKDLTSIVDNFEIKENYSKFIVGSEKLIPKINKTYVENGIKVYRLEVDEPSLEEIFINLNDHVEVLE